MTADAAPPPERHADCFVEAFLSGLADRVVLLDPDGCVTHLSETATLITLRTAAAQTLFRPGVSYLDLCRRAELAGLAAAKNIGESVLAVLRGSRPEVRLELSSPLDGRLLELQVNPLQTGGAVVVHRDVTGTAARLLELHQLAYSDALTGLTNRTYFFEEAERRLALAQQAGRTAAFLYLDLDGFKNVNDTLGHTVGDTVLKIVGARLQGLVRSGDLLARLGGDEFAFFLQTASHKGVAGLVKRIHQVLRQPVVLDGAELQLGVSVGVALSHVGNGAGDTADLATLLNAADRAMYAVKQRQA